MTIAESTHDNGVILLTSYYVLIGVFYITEGWGWKGQITMQSFLSLDEETKVPLKYLTGNVAER